MPDGQTHNTYRLKFSPVAIFLSVPVTWITMLIMNYFQVDLVMMLTTTLLSFVGYFVGYLLFAKYIDPDADLLGITSSEWRAMRDLGVLGFLIVWWMMPYAYIMKWFGGHRGISHIHIVGTLTRVLWLAWLPAWLLFKQDVSLGLYTTSFFLGVFLGLSLADSVHIFLDNRLGD